MKPYETPQIEIEHFTFDDVLTTSGFNADGTEDPFGISDEPVQ